MPLRFAQWAEEAYQFPLTIGHLLDAALMSCGDQEIVYRDQVCLSYRKFRERIGRLATVLANSGAQEGTTVAVMDWDSHRYLEAYFAIPMMGAVIQTVNIRLAPAQIVYTLKHAGAEILIAHRDFFPLLMEILPQLPSIKAVIAIADGAEIELPPFAVGEYESLSAAADPGYAFRDFDENALASTFYTTGTTGVPKGVCFSHRQLVLLTVNCRAPFGVTQPAGLGHGDVYMPLTPMFHVHAWGVPYMATMLGLKQVYPGRYEANTILDLREREGVTISHCVPTVLRMVLDAAAARNADLSGWRMKIGGSALTPALYRDGRRRGLKLISGYGMSETGPTVAVARLSASEENEDACMAEMTASGVPVPLVSARIVDPQMRELPADGKAVGELVVRAPWLTPCYLNDPVGSEELWRGGWLHTRDVATIAPDGTIIIRDRLKDVIKTGGEWVSSLYLEGLISEVAGVMEVAVIAVPHEKWGERPIAVIVPTSNADLDLTAINAPILAAASRGEISRYAQLDRVELVDALPRTSVGKVDKKALRARFEEPTQAIDRPNLI